VLIEAKDKPNNLKLTSLHEEASLVSSSFSRISLEKLLLALTLQLNNSFINPYSIPEW
jgi:hypothetical protein